MNQRAIDALLSHYVGPEELGRLLELTELQIRGLDGIARQDALARSASLKREAGDITGAIQDLEGARRGREDDLRLTGLLADLYGESGRVEQAETLLTELASSFENAADSKMCSTAAFVWPVWPKTVATRSRQWLLFRRASR